MSNGNWVRVGDAPVDSGTMMLVDPCYVLVDKRDDKDSDEYVPLEYSEALGFEHDESHPESYASRLKLRDNGDYEAAYVLGGRGKTPYGSMGYFFDTNWGDGSYPVFARIDPSTGRTTGVFISFADEPEDEWEVEDEVEDIY